VDEPFTDQVWRGEGERKGEIMCTTQVEDDVGLDRVLVIDLIL
jgi:hypothetical protein